jgi:hypothetical protein
MRMIDYGEMLLYEWVISERGSMLLGGCCDCGSLALH